MREACKNLLEFLILTLRYETFLQYIGLSHIDASSKKGQDLIQKQITRRRELLNLRTDIIARCLTFGGKRKPFYREEAQAIFKEKQQLAEWEKLFSPQTRAA